MPVYNKYRYLFPPRPENAIPIDDIETYDNDSMIAQPKLNGSNCVIFTNGIEMHIMNRHNEYITNFQLSKEELITTLFKSQPGNWQIINGEYLNKSKKDENNQTFNHKLVIFDILTFNSDYLVGKTFTERIELLDELYGQQECEKDYLYKVTDNVYRVKSYNSDFKALYESLSKIDMIEGLVMKRKSAKLELGVSQKNNTKSQVKVRKPTKNYKF
jgi:ATP-dependent DNA ligase